jgi:hypothetical protein
MGFGRAGFYGYILENMAVRMEFKVQTESCQSSSALQLATTFRSALQAAWYFMRLSQTNT